MPYGKVLVVDDIETNLYVAIGLLAPYKIQTETAASGFAAIELVKAGNAYDVIFMDHMMPKMDGVEATRRIRELGYTLPIVALTANAVVGQANIFIQNGFDDFISKPIDIRQLNAILNRLIRDKQPPEVLAKARKMKENVDKNLPLLDNSARDLDLLMVFARDVRKALPVIESVSDDVSAATDEDISLFTINVHAMKSALANIGELRL
jgi:CheY-like chemotaxis protein